MMTAMSDDLFTRKVTNDPYTYFGRLREEDPVQHLNLVSLTTSGHRRDEIARTVVTETRSLLPRRAVVRAGDMGNVVLEMVLLKSQPTGINIKCSCHQRTHIAHGLFALTQTNKI